MAKVACQRLPQGLVNQALTQAIRGVVEHSHQVRLRQHTHIWRYIDPVQKAGDEWRMRRYPQASGWMLLA